MVSPVKSLCFGLFFIVFSATLHARDWESIRSSGELRIGIRDLSSLAYDSTSKAYPGFLYQMAQAFAKKHGLTLHVNVVTNFADYWTKDGEVLTQTGTIATPDIYEKIDIAAEAFTVTEARQQLIHMSPYVDNVELFFGDINQPIRAYEALIGKGILLYESMSFDEVLKAELEKRDIPYAQVYIGAYKDAIVPLEPYARQEDKVNFYLFPASDAVDGKMVYHYIANKVLDVSINDSLGIVFRLFSNSHYSENLRPYFPVTDRMTQLAWGSSHETPVLNEKIDTFIKEYIASGAFSAQMEYYTGMTLEEYNQLIMMIE